MKLLLKVSGVGVDFLEAEKYPLHHYSIHDLVLREKKKLLPPGSVIDPKLKRALKFVTFECSK